MKQARQLNTSKGYLYLVHLVGLSLYDRDDQGERVLRLRLDSTFRKRFENLFARVETS